MANFEVGDYVAVDNSDYVDYDIFPDIPYKVTSKSGTHYYLEGISGSWSLNAFYLTGKFKDLILEPKFLSNFLSRASSDELKNG